MTSRSSGNETIDKIELTCMECHLTYDKRNIEEGEMTRCPRCDSLVKA